ncbi:hypothetical protein SLOPH_623 [Spraguea lophii 42_110]|uniref:Uncharacterized protein n=1 Tax=Spraguea lophii (strain 42_110) TaxID=1358809 RepID=S7W540_SPRLO|nr:hypothetical protein SLOPH_623 [Spraguea lophii 42_110]
MIFSYLSIIYTTIIPYIIIHIIYNKYFTLMSMTKRILRSPDTSIFSEDSDCRCYKDYNGYKDNRNDNTYIDKGDTYIDRDYDNSINDTTYTTNTYTTNTTYNNNTDNIF